MNWTNDLTKSFNTDYPVIQAPMFGVTSPAMVAAATRAGCLGSLALGDMNAAQCTEAIHATRQLTGKPFAVNIFVHRIPELTEEIKRQYAATAGFVTSLARDHGLTVNIPDINQLTLSSYKEQIDTIIATQCRILSFTFGNLDTEDIQTLKNSGILLIGTCTSVREAQILEASGIDVICVQGIEAGGHRGNFATTEPPKIGGLSLLAQVRDHIKTPLIYAGGIYNARTLLAARTLGAQGYQVGSLLLSATESNLKEAEKERLKTITESDIILSRSFSGRYARGIKNTFTEAMESTTHILPYPYQNKLTNALRNAAKAGSRTDFVNIWAGQSIHPYSNRSTTDILRQLITESEQLSRQLHN